MITKFGWIASVLAVTAIAPMAQAERAAPKPVTVRAPYFGAKSHTYEAPAHILNTRLTVEQRLMNIRGLVSSSLDREVPAVMRAEGPGFKFDKARIEEWAKRYEDKSSLIERLTDLSEKEIKVRLANGEEKTLKTAAEREQYARELLRQRETEYGEFLMGSNKENKAEFELELRDIKNAGDTPGLLYFGKGGEKPVGEVRTAPQAQVGKDLTLTAFVKHDTATQGSKSSTAADKATQQRNSALDAQVTNLGSRLRTLGVSGQQLKSLTDMVKDRSDRAKRNGSQGLTTRQLERLNELLDFVAKNPAMNKDRETVLNLIETTLLDSRGVTETDINTLRGFIEGSTTPEGQDAYKGLVRTSQMLAKLRREYEKKNPKPKGEEDLAAYNEARDLKVGEHLRDWMDFGEGFRKSVGTKEGFDKWMAGTHEHLKKADKDKRPDEAIGKAVCNGNCAGWARLARCSKR